MCYRPGYYLWECGHVAPDEKKPALKPATPIPCEDSDLTLEPCPRGQWTVAPRDMVPEAAGLCSACVEKNFLLKYMNLYMLIPEDGQGRNVAKMALASLYTSYRTYEDNDFYTGALRGNLQRFAEAAVRRVARTMTIANLDPEELIGNVPKSVLDWKGETASVPIGPCQDWTNWAPRLGWRKMLSTKFATEEIVLRHYHEPYGVCCAEARPAKAVILPKEEE